MNDNNGKYVFLLQVYNDVEADIVEGLLSQYNIPVIKKYRGNRSFIKTIMGTVLGVDVFVRAEDFKEAKEIVENTDLNEFYSDFPE